MSDQQHKSIQSLVLGFVHSCGGKVDYDLLAQEVKKHFPASKWQRTHWVWYRSQILSGRFKQHFSDDELAALAVKPASQPAAVQTKAEAQTTPVTREMLAGINSAVIAARMYENATNGRRKLGLTGEVGEVRCCQLLGLRLCIDPRSMGFDAIDVKGKRVQIKSRRSETEGLPREAGRIGTFSLHGFDYALLVLLDPEYDVVEIWRAESDEIADLIKKHKRRNPPLASFKRRAHRVWPTA